MRKELSFVLLMLPALLWSQEKNDEDVSYNEEFKLSALPYYSYGKGLGMTSADSLFQLNIRFRMQNRVTYYNYDDENQDAEYEAQIRRLRLRLDGYVGDPKFQYALQFHLHQEIWVVLCAKEKISTLFVMQQWVIAQTRIGLLFSDKPSYRVTASV